MEQVWMEEALKVFQFFSTWWFGVVEFIQDRACVYGVFVLWWFNQNVLEDVFVLGILQFPGFKPDEDRVDNFKLI